MTTAYDKSTQFSAIAGDGDVASMIQSFLASQGAGVSKAMEVVGDFTKQVVGSRQGGKGFEIA